MPATNRIKSRGGKRPGAGRKPTGITVTISTICLPPSLWSKLDAIRGPFSRSAWIAKRIKKARNNLTKTK